MEGKFERNAALWMIWSVSTFKKATSISSLNKAQSELKELQNALAEGVDNKEKLAEYADVMMCVLNSAAKEGFNIGQLTEAMVAKMNINFEREWELDPSGNTYSHIQK